MAENPNFETATRMQASVTEALDLPIETQKTRKYGTRWLLVRLLFGWDVRSVPVSSKPDSSPHLNRRVWPQCDGPR